MRTVSDRPGRRAFSRNLPDAETRPAGSTAGSRAGSRSLLAMATWFGLATGLLELGLRLVQGLWDNRVTVASIRTNHHWTWMVPVSDLMIFVAVGLLLGLLLRSWPRIVVRLAPHLFCTLAFLAPLLAIRGLYPLACVALACGIGSRMVPLLDAHAGHFRNVVRWSTPWMVGTVLLLIGLSGGRVLLAERRARASLPAHRPGAPNVLLIVMDNVRADDLSLYDYHRDTSPNLKSWARRGIRFDQARSTAPWTLPSHASMLTGRWPHQLSAAADRPLDATHPTLAEFLAGRGYATAGFVANTFYCNAWYGLDRGFSRYEDFYENREVSGLEILRSSTLGERLVAAAGIETATPGGKASRKTAAMINRDALGWLSHQGDRPFFAFLNYYDAHGPFQPPDGFDRRYGLGAEPLKVRESILRDYARLRSGKAPAGGAGAKAAAEQIRKAGELWRDSYDSCIAYLDEQLGVLLATLEARGMLANTLVIVTSDHGEHFGDRNLFGHGHSLYRPLVHVPLLIIPPSGESKVRDVDDPVSLRDLPATVVDLLQLRQESPFPGRSLARYWDSGSSSALARDEPLLSEVEHQKKFPPSPHIPASLGPLQSVVADDRVYIRNSDGREELYDLEGDPSESHNLAGEAGSPPVLERFRDRLSRLLKPEREPDGRFMDGSTDQRNRSNSR